MGRRGNNEGTIRRRPDGRWEGQISVGYDSQGKRKRRSFYGRTRAEVVQAMEVALAEIRAGTYVAPSDLTVGQWLDTWLREYAAPSIRPATWRSYESNIRVHLKPALGSVRLRHLQAAQVQRLLNDKLAGGLSPRSVEIMYTILHAALKQAAREGLVSRNVADYAKKPRKQRREMRVLTNEEMGALLNAAATERLGICIEVLLGTGLRRGELVALRWQDVDLQSGVIHVTRTVNRVRLPDGSRRTTLSVQEPKTAAGRRSVPLPPSVLLALRQWRARQNEERLIMGDAWVDTGLVFTTPLGTMVDPDNLAHMLARVARRAGLSGVTAHTLRHTYATRLAENGVPAKIAQELMGHSTITLTLDIYTHVLPEQKRAVAGLLDGVLTNAKSNGSQMAVKRG